MARPAPQMNGKRPDWTWASDLALYVGENRKWADGGAAISAIILDNYADLDATDPAVWDNLAATVKTYFNESGYPGVGKLASTYVSAGGTNRVANDDDDQQSAGTIFTGTVQGSVEDVAVGVTAVEDVAKSGAKGLSKLVKSPLGILLGIAALGLGVAASRRL